MHQPTAVAGTLIKKAEANGNDITHLQLQKMLYFCHALMLGCYGRPLLNQQFQAWQYGPVMASVYDTMKGSGDLPIDAQRFHDHEQYDEDETEVIDAVYAYCQGKHGYTLVKMACKAGAPWDTTRKTKKRNAQISNDKLQIYFGKFYERQES